MARIRTIKPQFFTSEDIADLSPLARLLYIALWCEADRDGRFHWKPKAFRIRYLPLDSCDIEEVCRELEQRGLVVVYGKKKQYAHIPSFLRHQRINPKECSSDIPTPPPLPSDDDEESTDPIQSEPEPNPDSPQDQSRFTPDPIQSEPEPNPEWVQTTGKGREGKGKEGKGRDASQSDEPREVSEEAKREDGDPVLTPLVYEFRDAQAGAKQKATVILSAFREEVRQGTTPEAIRASIRDPARDKGLAVWDFVKLLRLRRQPPKPANKSAYSQIVAVFENEAANSEDGL